MSSQSRREALRELLDAHIKKHGEFSEEELAEAGDALRHGRREDCDERDS